MNQKNKYFVAGIHTNIGKTIISTILVELLNAKYWKPIQCGNLRYTDARFVSEHISSVNNIMPETYLLKKAVSPHAAAKLEGVEIKLDNIVMPEWDGSMVIEGAGGLMVPLNEKELVIDLIKKLQIPVILVSMNYLGSINHTLLSVKALHDMQIPIAGIIFNGEENKETENIIASHSKVPIIGRIPWSDRIDREFIKKQASILGKNWEI